MHETGLSAREVDLQKVCRGDFLADKSSVAAQCLRIHFDGLSASRPSAVI